MATTQRFDTAYGQSQPLLNEFPAPLIANRVPTTADKAQLGSLWINKLTNDAWVLTSVVNNSATWLGFSSGTGTFSSITVTPGNITVTNGNIVTNVGTITAGGSLIANAGINVAAGNISLVSGSITLALGNLNVTAGSVLVAAGRVAAVEVQATGDLSAGTAGATSLTNVTDTAQSTGVLSILSDSANPGNNAGFIKMYVGTTVAYVPYFTDIAP